MNSVCVVGPCKRCGLPISIYEEGTRFQAKCAGNPACQFGITLPSGISSLHVVDSTCSNCTHGNVHLVKFGFQMASLPTDIQRLLHGPIHEGCIICDPIIVQILQSGGVTRDVTGRGRTGLQALSTVDVLDMMYLSVPIF